MFEQRKERLRRDAVLARVARDVDLDQRVDDRAPFLRQAREALRELEAVERVHPGEIAGDESGLVRLQVADEMPLEAAAGEVRDLGERLLHGAFAEGALAGPDRRLDRRVDRKSVG